ncbi:hypothetical protein [Aeromonas enteropelogenes]|uniref:hypothetical protein n=1 Tax=Aeromonas enteropelogenes TaxID=29489 RepID=UPI003BA2AA34
MSNFYQENEGLPEVTTKSGGKAVIPRQSGHLDKPLDYYVHRELPIVIGIYSYTVYKNRSVNTYSACEVICLETGIVLTAHHKYSLLAKRLVSSGKLNFNSYYLGSYKPLDPSLQEKINNKRKSRAKNK